MIEKVKTAYWFLQRPSFWAQAVELGRRKFTPDNDSPELRRKATQWASERAVDVAKALGVIGLHEGSAATVPQIPQTLLKEAEQRAARSAVEMGGPGDIDLLYAATRLSSASRAIETGVAYGWSSLAILAGLEGGRLVSVDMPYPKMNNEDFVGIVVSEQLGENWQLIREPDRNGLKKAIAKLGGTIDLCHYDSDKSYRGRKYAYPMLSEALEPGGVFISDDIQDNFAFKEFVESWAVDFAVTAYQGKFVGIARKPL